MVGEFIRYAIPVLSVEERETLQVDAALRLIGEYAELMVKVNQAIADATIDLGKAKIQVDLLRNDKQTLVELIRSMKVIVQGA